MSAQSPDRSNTSRAILIGPPGLFIALTLIFLFIALFFAPSNWDARPSISDARAGDRIEHQLTEDGAPSRARTQRFEATSGLGAVNDPGLW